MAKQVPSAVAYILTSVGIMGVIISLVTMQSDYDTVAFGIATVSILVAIVGISLVFKSQSYEQPNVAHQGNMN